MFCCGVLHCIDLTLTCHTQVLILTECICALQHAWMYCWTYDIWMWAAANTIIFARFAGLATELKWALKNWDALRHSIGSPNQDIHQLRQGMDHTMMAKPPLKSVEDHSAPLQANLGLSHNRCDAADCALCMLWNWQLCRTNNCYVHLHKQL